MAWKKKTEDKEISPPVSATLSVAIGIGMLWAANSIIENGSEWRFSVIALAVPVLFAIQGMRGSFPKGSPKKWRNYTRTMSALGLLIAGLSFVAYLILLAHSSPA